MSIQYISVKVATPEQKANAPYKVSGVKPSLNPHKHWLYSAVVSVDAATLPPKSSNGRPKKILDQGKKGACTGFAGSNHSSYEFQGIDGAWVEYSEDFLYNLARTLDGLPDTEEGSTGEAIMKVKQKYGVCPASFYPYREDITGLRNDIPQQAYAEALKRRIDAYARTATITDMKSALASGKTLLTGVLVTDTFMHPDSNGGIGGFVGQPNGYMYGGHEINIFDYDDTLIHTYANGKQEMGFFLFANSWTEQWGDNGIGYLPYSFLNYATDIGMHFFMEAWTSVPTPTNPPASAPAMELWVGNPTANVKGVPVTLEQPPYNNNGHVVLGIRDVSEGLGHKVDWDQDQQKVTIW